MEISTQDIMKKYENEINILNEQVNINNAVTNE
jgi:hypothetical protein